MNAELKAAIKSIDLPRWERRKMKKKEEVGASLDALSQDYEDQTGDRADDGSAYTKDFVRWLATKYFDLLEEARRWGYKA